ncbi:MAG: hypothetical protein HRF50_10270 [Phycisphaerae bacterium]
MSKNERLVVVKRDGALESFDFSRLRRSLASAMHACGYDAEHADALGRAVMVHLGEWRGARPPTTEYVHRCVRTVLSETGLSDVAESFAMFRKRRDAGRRSVRVASSAAPDRSPATWEKARIARSLERRAELQHSTARILAGDIERRVLALGYSVVTTGLLRELVENELLAWGLSLAPGADAAVPDQVPAAEERYRESQ